MVAVITKAIIRVRTIVWILHIIFHRSKEIFHTITLWRVVKTFVKPREGNIVIMIMVRNNQLPVLVIHNISCMIWHCLNWHFFSWCHAFIDWLRTFFLRLLWISFRLVFFLFIRRFGFQIFFCRLTLRFWQIFLRNIMAVCHVWRSVAISLLLCHIMRIKDITVWCRITTCSFS